MKRVIEEWTAKELYSRRNLIQYPDYQREPSVWNDEKKKLLIDSILIGLDIPKIYLYKSQDSEFFDCVDGQQRIESVIEFLEGRLSLKHGKKLKDLSVEEKETIFNYKFTMAIITEANEDELRLLFLRLQLGTPLNAGEKLHAMAGDMKAFVFDVGKNHPFFEKVDIPERRFAKETVFAQICINSFYRSLKGSFYAARFSDLKGFFEQYSDLKGYGDEIKLITTTLDMMDAHFGTDTKSLKNRASIVSGYLFFEQLIKTKKVDKLDKFVEFYLEFLDKLAGQARKGLDYDPEYRQLLDFQYYIYQTAVAKLSIQKRHEILTDYFEYYLKTGEIRKD